MIRAARLADWFLPLARRLLYLWVRSAVFPENAQALRFDPTKPVCYVLQDRHLSNLLVLVEESRRGDWPRAEAPLIVGGLRHPRSFFFLDRDRRASGATGDHRAHSALLASLNEHNYALALVTSSLTWMMDLALSMTQTGQHFHTKICADDVQRHKPAPDAYLLALERLQLTRQAAVVIEDSQTGIAAAKAAKLPVIAIRHDFNGRHDFSAADQVIDSLTDTDAVLELIESLLAGK